jgi:L-ribulose-5-phosphate 4-epimerase
MKHCDLREAVCAVNREIGRRGLAKLTWGNASAVDREAGVMAIKPSGVPYDMLTPEDVVVLSLADGARIEGRGRPSSDAPTHLVLYRGFACMGGVVHTHSRYATAWAQAGRGIPCFGTTHADAFHGPVPVTRDLTREEVEGDYEAATGSVILECFERGRIDPLAVPAVLVRGHAPFAWGATAAKALENAVILEEVAAMALHSVALTPTLGPVPAFLLDKHHERKHGARAYYGQG